MRVPASPRPWSQEKAGRVQQTIARVRQIRDGVLYVAPRSVRGAAHPRPHGVAVIEVAGTTFALRSEDDRAALILGYQALVRALAPGRSIQMLIRRVPYDLSGYLARLDAVVSDRTAPPVYRELAAAHADHVERLAGDRSLYASRCYLIFSAEEPSRASLAERFGARRRAAKHARDHAATRSDLDIQSERLLAALAEMNLSAHRLSDRELLQLVAGCLSPEHLTRHDVPDPAHLALDAPVSCVPLPTPGATSVPKSLRAAPRPDRSGKGTPRRKVGNVAADQQPGFLRLSDLVAPSAVLETADHLLVEDEYARSLAVVGYPREVTMGYLTPLLTHDDPIDISIHVHMQDPIAMVRQYQRRKAEIRATKRMAVKKGWVENPDEAIAQSDIERLLLQVASREEALCEVSMVVQVRADSLAALNERTNRLLSVLKNLFLAAHPTTFEHLAAYQTMQPWCDDALRRTQLLDTMSVAYGFPFVSSALTMPGGVLEGVTSSGEPVIIDDWADELDNPHRFIGAITGAGKSYDCKLKMLREILLRYHEGLQVAVIDPEREYERLCITLGGTFVRLAPGSPQHLNPFDLIPQGMALSAYLADHRHRDRLAENVQGLHALYDFMLSDYGPTGVTLLSTREKGLLDRGTYEAYRRRDITADPAAHGNAPPTLHDLYDVLASGAVGKDEYGLCDRLYRYVEGSLAGIFSAPTDVQLDNRFVVFDVRDMSGELRPIGIFLIANFMWTQVLADTRPRVLYIDEAWSLIQHPEGGRFLADLARRARKRYLRLVTITQSPELFIADPHGAVIAGNAATKILKKQDRTSAPAIASRFGLTLSERQKLLTLQKPEALLLTGSSRLIVTVEANPLEHELATTNPRELAGRTLAPLAFSKPSGMNGTARHLPAPRG